MSESRVATVAKKKPAKRANRAADAEGGDERVAVMVLKGSPEYREWLQEVLRDSLIPIASIVRDAISKWPKDRGDQTAPKH